MKKIFHFFYTIFDILGIICEIEKSAMRNIYANKQKYLEMFNLLINLLKLKSHNDLIEDWLKSPAFFKNLESIMNFNFSDNKSFIKILEESRKDFILNPENKKFKLESKKQINKYYLKFLNHFRDSLCKSEIFKKSDTETNNEQDQNIQFKSFFQGNKLNIPDFAFEKIREFIKISLIKSQEKNFSDCKNMSKITNFYGQSKTCININSCCNDSKIIVKCDEKTPLNKITTIEAFRHEILDNIFKNFKAYSHNENHSYMEISWKLYDLNDLNIMNFHMFLFDILIEKILDNENFLDQISINNWYYNYLLIKFFNLLFLINVIFILHFDNRIDKKNPFQKGNSNDIYLGGTLNTVKLDYFTEIRSKFCNKNNDNSLWTNIFHYILYASEGLLVKSLTNLHKSFENLIRDDPLRIEIKLEKESGRRFSYLMQIFMKFISPKMIKVNIFFLIKIF